MGGEGREKAISVPPTILTSGRPGVSMGIKRPDPRAQSPGMAPSLYKLHEDIDDTRGPRGRGLVMPIRSSPRHTGPSTGPHPINSVIPTPLEWAAWCPLKDMPKS